MPLPEVDFLFGDEGTLVLVTPLTGAARDWWIDNVGEGPTWGRSYVVEHRYVHAILDAVEADGFTTATS